MKKYIRKTNVTFAELDGKYSLFIVSIGSYINLNSTASKIWKYLKDKLSLEELKELFLEQYQIDEKLLEKDILTFLEKAKNLDIIDVCE